MEDSLTLTSTMPPRGSRPALIEAFGIRGLHGYRTISLKSAHAATILIARNGTGKTTLLGVLDAFLRCQYSRLRELEFESIFCKFRDIPEQLVLTRADLDEALTPPETGELINLSTRAGISPSALFKYVTEDWYSLQDSPMSEIDNATHAALFKLHGFSRVRHNKVMSELYASAYEHNSNIARIARDTTAVVRAYDIVYLPTYRRVEVTLRGEKGAPHYRRKRPRFDVAAGSFYTGDIRFGLTDISDRLSEMNEQIAFESNIEYRKISAAIINELIDGSFENEAVKVESFPSQEDLKLLFSRVEQSRQYGPFDQTSIPNLEKLYSPDGVPASSQKFLSYFLGQLDRVIEKTRAVELRVQEFVLKCNKYLSSDELSTVIDADNPPTNYDAKRLVLNRSNLQVKVVSVHEGQAISLDALSSGEKQMVSLFAKLYLYEKPKIVLIDEPELSLSIDWQKEILVDVINSPLCEQMVAITHSPFVFDNELECYAGSLLLQVAPTSLLPFADADFPFDDVDFEYEDDIDE